MIPVEKRQSSSGTTLRIITGMAVLTGAGHVVADYLGPPVAVYALKPLTMLLIITIAVRSVGRPPLFYPAAVTVGLVISLVGDVFLMLPGDYFLLGLMFFYSARPVSSYARFYPDEEPHRWNMKKPYASFLSF
jgi:uncharacterized membrane protein YhhN